MPIDLIFFGLSHYAAIALLAVLSYGIGSMLTRSLKYHSSWEKIAICTGLGLGTLASAIFGLGLVHSFYFSSVLALLALTVILCFPVWKELLHSAIRIIGMPVLNVWRIGGMCVLILMLPIFLMPLYPSFFGDASMYHLAAAKISVQVHQVAMTPFLRYPVFPRLNEMLFSLSLLADDDILAQLVQFLMMLLVAITLLAWGKRFHSGVVGSLAAASWLATPLVLWMSATAGVDIGLTLFVTLGTYAFFNWMSSKATSWLILSGIFIGFAAGSKYSAFVFVGVLGIATIYWAIRDRNWMLPVIFGVTCACIAAPWYLFNLYYTGNPVFPFFGNIFGYGMWNADDLSSQMRELASWGTGRTIQSFLLLPWNLAFNQQPFHLTEAPLLPFQGLVLPIALISSIKNRPIRGLAGLSLAYVIYWFLSAQVLRYLIPILPLLCLIAAILFWQFIELVPFLRNRRFRAWTATIAVTVLLLGGSVYAKIRTSHLSPLPVTPDERDSFYSDVWIGYDAYKFLNDHYGQNYTLYALGEEYMAYFADGIFMGDWFGPARYDDITKLANGQDLYQKLKSLNAAYFLVDFRQANIVFPTYKLPQDDFFNQHFELVYARAYIRVFKLDDTPLQRTDEPQLLQNPGFEDRKEGQVAGWKSQGSPAVDASGLNSHTGLVATESQGDLNAYYQGVPVVPGQVYLLAQYARAKEQEGTGRLQINWSDAQGKFLRTDIEVIKTDPDWRHYEMAVTAPERAATAFIFASADGQSSIWLDDMTFQRFKYVPK